MRPSDAAPRRRATRAETLSVPTRPWFLAGFLHLVVAAVLATARTAGAPLSPPQAPVLFTVAGIFLVCSALAYGFASPFLKREILAPRANLIPLAGLVAVETAGLVAFAIGRDPTLLLRLGLGISLIAVPIHLLASAAFGPPWRGGLALFAKDQPYRRGDMLAAACFALGLMGFASAGALFVAPPRDFAGAGVATALLAGAQPFLTGALVFLLPRNAKTPMPGLTLVVTALVFQTIATAGIAYAFARPFEADLRTPPALLALATGFTLVAFGRLRVPTPGPQFARARPMLRGASALAVLATLATILATYGGTFNELLGLALHAHLATSAILATAVTLLGSPILLNAVPREGRWAAWSAALAILGLFLIAPSFQYDRPAFPGALAFASAALLAVWGLAPMRRPRREC